MKDTICEKCGDGHICSPYAEVIYKEINDLVACTIMIYFLTDHVIDLKKQADACQHQLKT
jgi:hypothetical protein